MEKRYQRARGDTALSDFSKKVDGPNWIFQGDNGKNGVDGAKGVKGDRGVQGQRGSQVRVVLPKKVSSRSSCLKSLGCFFMLNL